jgi:putative thioredoxin
MTSQSQWIIETTRENFERDVLDRSRTVPVVVDFWAAWCQPCRMLGPILENLAEEYQGQFVLVKADTDRLPDIAASLGVQSIPAVFAFRDGQLVDQFVGALSARQVRTWLEGILPTEAEHLAAEATSLEQTDPKGAEAKYRQALAAQPNDLTAQIGLARSLLMQDRLEEARQAVEKLAAAGALNAEGERLQAEIRLRLAAREADSLEQARAAAEANPGSLQHQWNLARALVVAGHHEEAMQVCLRLVEKDRHGLGEQARALMVDVFHVLGPDDALANEYRRKLSMALY